MNFQEAEAARRNLDTKKQNGKLSEEEYCAEINKIRITDTKNCWWQPDPRGPGWLFWNGKDWVAGVPPGPGTVAGPAPAPGAAGKTAPQKPAKPVEYHFRPVSDDEPGYKLMSLDEFRFHLKTRSWKNRPRKWWDLFSILTGVALAAIWFVYTFLSPSSEGWDFITPLLMIAIPVILVSFRKPIDELLMPLQPHRAKLPRLLLLGVGICIPFLTAWVLLNLLNVREYSLIRVTMVAGTCMAYAVTRDPVLAAGFTRRPVSLKAPLAILLFLALVIQIVRGDDCASNPLNGSDCLRTPGYGEGMAGGASAAGAGANAAGDYVTTDPGFEEWTKTLEPGKWYKTDYGWVKVNSDGTVTVKPDSSGTSGTGTEGDTGTSPDGTPPGTSRSTRVNGDGSTTEITTHPDGSTTTSTTSADGKTTTTTEGGGVTHVTTTGADGTKTTTTTYPDGKTSTTTRTPDGTTSTRNTDGSVTTRTPDGTETTAVTSGDGSTTVTYPDGTTVTTDPDGTVTTTTTWPDGTRTTTTQNPDGTTDVSERGGPELPDEGSGEPGGTGESGDGGETGGFGGEEK